MCCSYHIRGKRDDHCHRAQDKPQAEGDAKKLQTSCVPCFANADAALD
jgi:hypothetical protein